MSSNEVFSGLVAGVLSAVVFNPLDKAIFISTTKNISFFNRQVWSNCFKGTSNAILSRLVSSGLYFSFIDHFSQSFFPVQTAFTASFLVNVSTNPVNLVKFHSWFNNLSTRESVSFFYKSHGIRGFYIGFPAVFLRDFIFNTSYISFRRKEDHLFNLTLISGSLILVSPLNLVKNLKYGSNQDLRTIVRNFKFRQLGLSQSILRTSLSFYFSQHIYDISKSFLEKNK